MIIAILATQLATQPVPGLAPARPPAQHQGGIDFSNMPVEDAVMLMFGILAEDARSDTRAMLEEMQQLRLKRSAMREAQDEMTKELQRLKTLSGGEALARVDPTAISQRQWASQLTMLCGKLSGVSRSQCLESAVRKRTEKLRAQPSPK